MTQIYNYCRANNRDNDLKDQLRKSDGSSIYTSSFIPNEFINTFGYLIQYEIVTNAKKSISYSVLANENINIS